MVSEQQTRFERDFTSSFLLLPSDFPAASISSTISCCSGGCVSRNSVTIEILAVHPRSAFDGLGETNPSF
jgi:hypothetical protein